MQQGRSSQGIRFRMEIEKVLIVEDEENERNGLAELISAWGFRTETARDGVEGLEKLLSWSPGIVVSDLKMPRMDGLGLLEKVAQSPARFPSFCSPPRARSMPPSQP